MKLWVLVALSFLHVTSAHENTPGECVNATTYSGPAVTLSACSGVADASAANMYCMRNDTRLSLSDDDNLRVVEVDGCPTHGFTTCLTELPGHYSQLRVGIPTDPQIVSDGVPAKDLLTGGIPIGISVNGIQIVNEDHKYIEEEGKYAYLIRTLDECAGDGTLVKARYLYRGLPTCLLEELGIPLPDVRAYMEPGVASVNRTMFTLDADNMQNFVDLFPETGEPRLMGYMLDGFGIYAPYSEDGTLIKWGNTSIGSQEPASYYDFVKEEMCGGTTDGCDIADQVVLDMCNGLEVDGEYRYYFTPTPPFVPPCLRGDVTRFSYYNLYRWDDLMCPPNGMANPVEGGGDNLGISSAYRNHLLDLAQAAASSETTGDSSTAVGDITTAPSSAGSATVISPVPLFLFAVGLLAI